MRKIKWHNKSFLLIGEHRYGKTYDEQIFDLSDGFKKKVIPLLNRSVLTIDELKSEIEHLYWITRSSDISGSKVSAFLRGEYKASSLRSDIKESLSVFYLDDENALEQASEEKMEDIEHVYLSLLVIFKVDTGITLYPISLKENDCTDDIAIAVKESEWRNLIKQVEVERGLIDV